MTGTLGVVVVGMSKHQLLDANQVGQDFRDGTKQWRRDGLTDFSGPKERLSEHLVLDDRHAVVTSHITDAKRDMIGAHRQHLRREVGLRVGIHSKVVPVPFGGVARGETGKDRRAGRCDCLRLSLLAWSS